MTMITPSYLGETIEYSSLHACRSTLEDPTVLSRVHGLTLSVVAVDPLERYEVCDVCGNRAMPYSTFFDGKRYFCPDCLPDKAAPGLSANPS